MEFDFFTKDEINAMLGGLTFVKISLADFEALTTKDADTVYYVYDDDGTITQYMGDAALATGSGTSGILSYNLSGTNAAVTGIAEEES